MTPPDLYGLVLTGGRSTRMGRDKALLTYREAPQVRTCFDLLTPLCQRVWVSARAGQKREGFPLVIDRHGGRGPLDGILSAMEAHPGHAWLVVACDMPRLDAQTLRLLVERRDPSRRATAFRSAYDNRPEPLCAIYEPALEPALRSALEGGRASARDIMKDPFSKR